MRNQNDPVPTPSPTPSRGRTERTPSPVPLPTGTGCTTTPSPQHRDGVTCGHRHGPWKCTIHGPHNTTPDGRTMHYYRKAA